MSKQQCYVAVDYDGTEKMSNNTFIRRRYLNGQKIKSVFWGLFGGFYKKNEYRKWADMFSSDENDFLPFSGVILPKGTIEKLIGRKMSWTDEPVEISSFFKRMA